MLTHCMLAYHLPLLIAFSIRSVLPQTLPMKPFLVFSLLGGQHRILAHHLPLLIAFSIRCFQLTFHPV